LESSSSGSPEAQPAAPGPRAQPLEYVGFWKRLVAALIDVMVLIVVVAPIEWAIYGGDYFELLLGGKTLAVDLGIQIAILVAVILFWRHAKATPGLLAISAKIVDAKTLAPAKTGKLVLRAVALAVMLALFIPLGIGLLWIGIDRKKQGFHDKIAGTVVIYDDD
jgi:uncharacterized RDD family membrane protein YckC